MEIAGTVIAGIGLLLVAISTLFQSLELRSARRLTEFQINVDIEARLGSLYPELYEHLELPVDNVPLESRLSYTKLLVLYAQVWKAYKLGLYTSNDWDGLRGELRYWAGQEGALATVKEFQQIPEAWPDGFLEFVLAEVASGEEGT